LVVGIGGIFFMELFHTLPYFSAFIVYLFEVFNNLDVPFALE
jgi:hypothetical protein